MMILCLEEKANMIEIFQPVKKDYSKNIGLNKKGPRT